MINMESLSPLLRFLLRTSLRYSFFLLLFYLFQPPLSPFYTLRKQSLIKSE